MQSSPPSSSRTREPVLGSHVTSLQIGMNRYTNNDKVPQRRQHQSRRRLSPMTRPVADTAQQYETQYLRNTGSLSDGNGRPEDVLDTAPPSDLDARFPALSPQPSPLNSRRRYAKEVERNRHAESPSSATENDEHFQTQDNGDVFASGRNARDDVSGLSFAKESGEDEVRWNDTQKLVNSFLSTRKQQRPQTTVDADQQYIASLSTGSVSPHLTQRYQSRYRKNDIAEIYHPDSVVMQRIDTVTSEVHALRKQVADLATLISRLLRNGPDPSRNEGGEAGNGNESDKGHGIETEDEETSRLPVCSKLKALSFAVSKPCYWIIAS